MGPPSSGGITVLQILGILNNFELSSNNPNDPEVWHLFLEASKLAYTDRGYYIADDDFIDVPIVLMLDEKYLKERSKLIKENSIISNPQKGIFNKDKSLSKLRNILETLNNENEPILMVTHYGTILAMTGINVDSGGVVAYDIKTKKSIKISLK